MTESSGPVDGKVLYNDYKSKHPAPGDGPVWVSWEGLRPELALLWSALAAFARDYDPIVPKWYADHIGGKHVTKLCPSDEHDFERTGDGYTCKHCGHTRGAYTHAFLETAKEMERHAALPEGERIDIEIKVRRKEIAELEAKIAVLQERRKSL